MKVRRHVLVTGALIVLGLSQEDYQREKDRLPKGSDENPHR